MIDTLSLTDESEKLKDNVFFGFSKLGSDDIRYTGFASEFGTPMDGEITRDHEPFSSNDKLGLIDPVEFKERALRNVQDKGNVGLPEIVVPRFMKSGEVRQPDYLIVFGEDINEKTQRLTKEYGVPIVDVQSERRIE